MQKIFIFLLFLSVSLFSIEVDIELLKKEIAQNPQNVTTRLILIRSYIAKDDYTNAQKLVNEVLNIDKNNKKALFLDMDIKKLERIKSSIGDKLSNSKKLSKYFTKLANQEKYKDLIEIYEILKRNNIKIDKSIKSHAIDSYLSLRQYEKSLNVLENSNFSPNEKAIVRAKIYLLQKDFQNAEEEYKSVLKRDDNTTVAMMLYKLYIEKGRVEDAKKLVAKYKKIDKKSKTALALIELDRKNDKKRVKTLIKECKTKNSYQDIKKCYYSLDNLGAKKSAIKILKQYVKSYPKDEKATLFLANNLLWSHKPNESLKVLKAIVDKTKNKDILILYTDILLQQNRKKEALPYLNRVARLDKSSKIQKKIAKIKADSYLERAIKAHRAKDFDTAIRYYKKNYIQTKNPKIAKEIAELMFVKDRAKEALSYYKSYLSSYPSDSKIRFRYAAALESLKMYKEAEVNYRRVALENKKLHDLSTYRYATSLIAQKDEKKWNYSRGVLRKLLDRLHNEPPSKKRNSLIKFTTATLKKVSVPMPKPKRYKDIMLTESQKKLIGTQTILVGSRIEKRDIKNIKSMLVPKNLNGKKSSKKDLTFTFHHLDDETINNLTYGVRVNNIVKLPHGKLSVEAQKARFKKSGKKYSANNFLAYYNFQNLSFSIGMSSFDDFNEMIAKLSYRKVFGSHDITFGLKSINGAFVNSNACMIENRLNVIQFSLYDAILLSNLDQFEMGLTVNRYDDTNINISSWAEYPIYKTVYQNFENVFALSGSYETNSKTDTCYYSADFFDGNYILVKPKLYFGKHSFLQGMGGIGYSFKNNDVLYNYGLNAVISAYDMFDIRVDCRHYQSGSSPKGANECFATAVYIW